MKAISYSCPFCKYSGVVTHSEGEYFAVVAGRVAEDHSENSPRCRADVREIKIGGE